MVKFGDQLTAQTIPQWRGSYVSYDRLKRIILRCQHAREKLIRIQTHNRSPDTPADAVLNPDSDEEQLNAQVKARRQSEATPPASPLAHGGHLASALHVSPRRYSAPTSPSRIPSEPNDDEGTSLLLPPPALRQPQPGTTSAGSTSSTSLSLQASAGSNTYSYGSLSAASSASSIFPISSIASSSSSSSSSASTVTSPAHSIIDISITHHTPSTSSHLHINTSLRQRSPSSSSRSISPSQTLPSTTSPHSTPKRRLSASPGRKSSTAVSPLLRHVNLKSYHSSATEDELAAADALEVEVSNFWALVEHDLNRVDALFDGKVAECANVLDSFFPCDSALSRNKALDKSPSREGIGESGAPQPVRPSPARTRFLSVTGSSLPDLRAVQSVYIELMQLKNFCRLNGVGFRKIVKKFDKTVNRETLPTLTEKLKTRNFMSSKALDELIARTTSFISRDKLIVLQMEAKVSNKTNPTNHSH